MGEKIANFSSKNVLFAKCMFGQFLLFLYLDQIDHYWEIQTVKLQVFLVLDI